jgi:hypothetical protein
MSSQVFFRAIAASTIAALSIAAGAEAPLIAVTAKAVKLKGGHDGIRFTLTNNGSSSLRLLALDIPGQNIFTTRLSCMAARSERYNLERAVSFQDSIDRYVTIRPGKSVFADVDLTEEFPGFHKIRAQPGTVLMASWLWCTDDMRRSGISPKAGTLIFENPLRRK